MMSRKTESEVVSDRPKKRVAPDETLKCGGSIERIGNEA